MSQRAEVTETTQPMFPVGVWKPTRAAAGATTNRPAARTPAVDSTLRNTPQPYRRIRLGAVSHLDHIRSHYDGLNTGDDAALIASQDDLLGFDYAARGHTMLEDWRAP
jgi:hypothetical protein